MSDGPIIYRPQEIRPRMTPRERLLTDVAINQANYGHLCHLRLKTKTEILTPEEYRDLKRLSTWWNALGENLKERTLELMRNMSMDTEDMTAKSGRVRLPGWQPNE